MVTKIILKAIFQNIKWERDIGKPIASKIKPILIWGHHHPKDGVA